MTPIFDSTLAQRIEKCGIIAVLVVDRVEDAAPLAKALLAGGVDVMELTLRTPAAMDALRAIRQAVPEMAAGVGTILTPEQVNEAAAAGAAFGVAPGLNPRVVEAAREVGLSFGPGILTPSEAELAVELGCKLLKFFPAEPSGGLRYLRAMVSPFAHLGLKFIPLGGLNAKNMASFLSDPNVAALGGSWLAPRDMIRAGAWDRITQLAAEAAECVKITRKSGI
jgi:2-dehydro-3-deoxyphosphogluconate aldolase/(4S)-4-hydroxy-2-oxoglutarate aldolase